MVDIHELQSLPLFQELPVAQFDALLKNLRPLSLEEDELLVEEGVTTRAPLFLIVEGELEVSRKDDAGVSRHITTLIPPTVVGEVEFLTDLPASATVRALSEVRGKLLPRERFEAMFIEGDPWAHYLALAIGRVVSKRLHDTNKLLIGARSSGVERARSP